MLRESLIGRLGELKPSRPIAMTHVEGTVALMADVKVLAEAVECEAVWLGGPYGAGQLLVKQWLHAPLRTP
jgi:hypothetical protein